MKIITNPKNLKKVITSPKEIKDFLNDSKIDKIYPSANALEGVLRSGKKLTIYHGIDPTGPQLHLGHSTNYFILRKLQELGHQIILLIGDFTAMIGDPTGKSTARLPLTREETLKNARGYKRQLSRILDFNSLKNPVKIKFNSQWLDKLTFKDLIGIMSNFTVQQMIIRDMFQQRINQNKPISLHEFLYPIMQGYDSVAMNVDMEIGGNDQMFNMLIGRDLMRIYNKKEKIVLTTKLLIASDTDKKIMSKSEGRFIALNDSPKEMYGKIMALPDNVILVCFELCTRIEREKIKEYEKDLKQGVNPRDLKAKLAREIVKIYRGEKESIEAEKEFNRIFKEKEIPSEIEIFKITEQKINILDLLVKTKMVKSKGEARRLVEQGGVKIDEKVIKDWKEEIGVKGGMILQVGKRRFIRINF